ncbi:Olfactory receptor 51I2 [Camelus dromedarius]|uniref:Olfactory receptor 51I2 n=1 Tax=Camelus dromedarius TaxID=9838 RepID=A0A5N4DM99_CAMDR|nr:Olfactory receptor 51I2 [Camelus dromedarius]
MFFIHLFARTGSGILLAMTFDRYVAICNPLRYASVLTNARVVVMGLSAVLRRFALTLVLPLLLQTALLHYGSSVVLFTFGLDSALSFIFYVFIFQSVLAIASRGECLKTLNTCVSHILAVLIFHVPMVSVSLVHRFGAGLPHAVHILMSIIYLFVPLMLNPIIYSIKTKEICRSVGSQLMT